MFSKIPNPKYCPWAYAPIGFRWWIDFIKFHRYIWWSARYGNHWFVSLIVPKASPSILHGAECRQVKPWDFWRIHQEANILNHSCTSCWHLTSHHQHLSHLAFYCQNNKDGNGKYVAIVCHFSLPAHSPTINWSPSSFLWNQMWP